MKRFSAFVLFAFVSVGLVLADSPKTQSEDPAEIEAAKQVEGSMGKAMIAGDVGKLSQIYADDFAEVGSDGKLSTKKDLSGEFAWMDLLEKRGDKWMIVRSAGARVVSTDWPIAQYKDPAVVETIKQFEQEVGDAMVARDVDKLNQTYADDWAMVGSSGKVFSKDGLLSDFKSGKHNLVSFENGPMDVQVFGDVAVVQASVREKRIQDGKDISGQFVFMDLLKKREGKWVIVRTLGAKVS